MFPVLVAQDSQIFGSSTVLSFLITRSHLADILSSGGMDRPSWWGSFCLQPFPVMSRSHQQHVKKPGMVWGCILWTYCQDRGSLSSDEASLAFFSHPQPLFLPTQKLLTWCHLVFHDVCYALANTSLLCLYNYQCHWCHKHSQRENMVPLAHQEFLPSFHKDWGNWMRFLILCPKFKWPLNVKCRVKSAITVNMFFVTCKSIDCVKQKCYFLPNISGCLLSLLQSSQSFLVIKRAEKPVPTEFKGSSPSVFTGFYLK